MKDEKSYQEKNVYIYHFRKCAKSAKYAKHDEQRKWQLEECRETAKTVTKRGAKRPGTMLLKRWKLLYNIYFKS